MIKIYSKWKTIEEEMFLDLNGFPPYTVVNDINEDFDFSIGWVDKKNCKKLIFGIWHNSENQEDSFDDWLEDPDVYIITNTYSSKTHPRIFRSDFLMDRTRAYYQQYPFKPDTQKWFFDAPCYILPRQVSPEQKRKIFVAPNGMVKDVREQKYKHRLVDFIKNYRQLGHMNDPMLWANSDINYTASIDEVLSIKQQDYYQRRGYSPPHNAYYEDSFIHICVETIEYGSTIVVTEKTYDPMIKGHFVLPFSTSGTIKYLKLKGFEFPDFIDYSYDNIVNDELRFNRYTAEIERLLLVNIEQWKVWWIKYQNIRLHNQKLFWMPEYSKLDFKNIIGNKNVTTTI